MLLGSLLRFFVLFPHICTITMLHRALCWITFCLPLLLVDMSMLASIHTSQLTYVLCPQVNYKHMFVTHFQGLTDKLTIPMISGLLPFSSIHSNISSKTGLRSPHNTKMLRIRQIIAAETYKTRVSLTRHWPGVGLRPCRCTI